MLPAASTDGSTSLENQAEIRHVSSTSATFRRDGTDGLAAILAGEYCKTKNAWSFFCHVLIIVIFKKRPQVLVEIDNNDREYNEITPSLESSNLAKKRKKDSPSPIALEPCVGNKAAVLSLLVRMPTGEF